MELFTSETDPEVLKALEEFEVKIINYEHMLRSIIFYIHLLLKEFMNMSKLIISIVFPVQDEDL